MANHIQVIVRELNLMTRTTGSVQINARRGKAKIKARLPYKKRHPGKVNSEGQATTPKTLQGRCKVRHSSLPKVQRSLPEQLP